MMNPTNINILSDSQESALFGEEEYIEIEREMDGALPALTANIKEELLDIPEENDNENDDNDNNVLTQILDQNLNEYYLLLEQNAILPLDETFPGSLNFQYTFADGGTGQDWVYSQPLDKLFIKMEKTLALRFTWDPNMEGLYLRTKMAFKLEQYRSDPVKRCHNHMASSNYINQAMEPEKIKHVVHCVNHSASIYEERNGHLSILTPLCTPEPGSQYVPMCYKFLCKNSCPSGMNRRPTELVFTLENSKNTVLGRRKLLVRVCSCPKRDKQKEEAELTPAKKHKAPNKSSLDTHPFKIELTVIGKENYLSVLKFAYDIMAGQAARTGQYEFFKPYMEDIQRKTP